MKPESAKKSFDEIDSKILQALSHDSRTAFLNIATQLGVDEKTVRNRFAKLRDRGLIQATLTISPDALPNCFLVHYGIFLPSDKKSEKQFIAQKLAKLPSVNFCLVVVGRYDLLLQAAFDTFEKMKTFELETLPGISEASHFESELALSYTGRAGISVPEEFF